LIQKHPSDVSIYCLQTFDTSTKHETSSKKGISYARHKQIPKSENVLCFIWVGFSSPKEDYLSQSWYMNMKDKQNRMFL